MRRVLPWRSAGAARVLVCCAVVFIFQLAPTPDDTYGAFVFSREFNLSPSLLAFSSALDLTVGMIGAALLFQRIALPPLAAFTMGAVSRALASAALLPLTLTAAPSTALYLAQNVVSALLVGLGFLPILGLAALAAPEGAEGTVFGLVITAQSLGTLVAAALAGTLSAALDVGASSGDGERSWQQLPQFICVCGLAKLATLIAVLPLLAWVVRPASLAVGSGRASTLTSAAAMIISADQIRRRWQVWLAQNRRRAATAFLVTAAVATVLLCVAVFASAPVARPAPTPTGSTHARPFPPVERMVTGQREAMARLQSRARVLSAAATPALLDMLSAAPFRDHLHECCSRSGIASWPAHRLLGALRDAAATAELVHNFDGFDWVTGATLEMLELNATSYFPTLWQARYLGYYGPMKPGWGHPRSCEDAAEEGIFGLEPFGGEHDLPTSWEQVRE